MTALAIEGSELRRWVLSGLVILGVHAAAASLLLTWHDPVGVGEQSDVVTVDFEPLSTPPRDAAEDVAPGPKQEEAETPPPERQQPEQKPDEKVDVPPSPTPAIAAVPPPAQAAPKPTEPAPVAPAPATMAPPRAHASRVQVNAWHSRIVMQIERHKAYPRAARERGETGVARLAFSIDREGHVLSSTIVKSSGFPELDAETIATVRRAQPFPPPPPGLDGARFEFTLPVNFSIR